MYKRKYKRVKQLLCFLLAFLLVVGDGSTIHALAVGTVSGAVQIETLTEQECETVEMEDMIASVSDNEAENIGGADEGSILETEKVVEIPFVSGSNIPLREPQDFYPEPESENYGTLVDYDEFSRTYHVGGDNYVTVIGNDANTYIDEEGKLVEVDNTLIENPVSAFGGFRTRKSDINSANDFIVQLEGEVNVNGGDLFTVVAGDYAIAMAPMDESFK